MLYQYHPDILQGKVEISFNSIKKATTKVKVYKVFKFWS